MQKILLTFADDIYEDLELWYPKLRCERRTAGVRAGFAVWSRRKVVCPDLGWRDCRTGEAI
jgi:hypothetical protein